jgi:hypothetical protein
LTSALAAWGITSAVTGVLIRGLGTVTSSPFMRGFGGQTAGWGVIDAGIAAFGTWQRSTTAQVRTPEQRDRLRRLLDINAAADLGYIAAGALGVVAAPTLARRFHRSPTEIAGAGLAIAIQGAFLWALDSTFAKRLADPDNS